RFVRRGGGLRRLSRALEFGGAVGERGLDLIPPTDNRLEQRGTGAPQLRQQRIDQNETTAKGGGHKLGEGIAERDAWAQPPRPAGAQRRNQLLHERLWHRGPPNHLTRSSVARGAQTDQTA